MVEYMKEQLQQLEQQRQRAKDALADIEKTISEIKQSTGYKIHSLLEKNKMNGVTKIQPRHDGTHVFFKENQLSADTLAKFKKFKLDRLYSQDGSMVAVFE